MSGIPPNSLFSALAFIGFLVAGLPLLWHMQSWNTGACMSMVWASLGCLILFVNSIVWNDNVINWAPVWCDICARYLIGASVGLPASSLCIIRRLYYITKLQTVSVSREEKRREIIVDVLIGVGFPCVVMAWTYVTQSGRFSIVEQMGCFPSISNTLPTYFLLEIWPLVIGFISLVYAVLTFRRAFQQKRRLKQILNSGFAIDHRRYWSLMAVCSSEIVFTVPLSLYVIILDVTQGVGPYVSWAWMHSDISQIDQYPNVIWQNIPHFAMILESQRWFYILYAFLLFGFFGWAPNVRGFYLQAFWSVCRRLGYSKPTTVSKRSEYAGKPTLPVYDVDQQMRSNHLSMSIQPRARYHESFRTSLSFEAPPFSESPSTSSLQLSVDKGLTEGRPRLPSLSSLARHTRISWTSMPAAPEPVLARDRCSRMSNQNVGQRLV